MVDLGERYAVAVNNAGMVVGDGWAWTADGGMINFPGMLSAVAVNDAGQVVGTGFTTDGSQHAFLWTPRRLG